MNNLESLARKVILNLKPYSSAREEFTGGEAIFLDANENPFNTPWNRYPDPFQQKLRQRLADLKGTTKDRLILGNGSDETIDMLFRTFCDPGIDSVLSISPTYGMYKVSAGINNVEYRTVLLNEDYSLPVEKLLEKADTSTKLIFLCSPNNPTANIFDEAAVETILQKFTGLVVIDEAYIDFCPEKSWVRHLEKYDNLVVLQTLSKAWGLASIRLGMAFAHPSVIQWMMKVKPPYNINAITQQKALETLMRPEEMQQRVSTILEERDQLMLQLGQLPQVLKVVPSDANFFLIQVSEADLMYNYLVEQGIIIRNRSHEPLCQGCLRITVGSKIQNQLLLEAISQYKSTSDTWQGKENPLWKEAAINLEMPQRSAVRERHTRETSIYVKLSLEGNARADIDTGLGFFDHMLDQIARHSGCDLTLKTQGDLNVDEHHTIEDTGIALGEAFAEALGDKRGIDRYGYALPMDDCAALALIDFGGRPDLVWKARFKRESIGDLPTEMFQHFFKSFAIGAKCNLYIKAKGKNEHHKIEAIFKALARAIKMAVKREPFSNQLPSTKGLL